MPVGSCLRTGLFILVTGALLRLPWETLSLAKELRSNLPGNAEITHVRRQQWLVGQVILTSPHRPLLAPSCPVTVAIPRSHRALAVGLVGGWGGRWGKEVTEKAGSETGRRGFGEARNQQVNNDSLKQAAGGVSSACQRPCYSGLPSCAGACALGAINGAGDAFSGRAHLLPT